MKRIDSHLHIRTREGQDSPDLFLDKLHKAGFDGSILISDHPASFQESFNEIPRTSEERLELLMEACKVGPDLYPFYWIDPTEEDAKAQVDRAVERGVRGFKVIPNHFFVGEERSMKLWRYIASKGKPILFHSGILWDWSVSAGYTKPLNFEPLLFIPGLKFAMAHVSWPWCDEMIALYGKSQFLHRTMGDQAAELYVDLTPGTPPSFREDVLRKLFCTGYDLSRIMFGSDCSTYDYGTAHTLEWVARDIAIYEKLGIKQEVIDSVYGGAFLRFIGEA